MKRFTLLSLIVVLALSSMAFVTPSRIDANKAFVFVLHGIPGQDLGLDPALPVDILVNDATCALQAFPFGQIAGPLKLPAGDYNFKISLANAENPCSNAPVIEADVPFAAGEVATVVAHLTESGGITASKYVNDISRFKGAMARLSVIHAAAAPTVDVKLSTTFKGQYYSSTIEDLSNPNLAGPLMVPTRPSYDVTIYPANMPDPVFGPVTVNFGVRTSNYVYAVGSLTNGTFTLITQTLPVR
jgi:hypothetical protein